MSVIQRGLFIIKNLTALDFESLVQRIEKIAEEYDKEAWGGAAPELGIKVEALQVLDAGKPPIPYPYYFCTPDLLIQSPELIMYYRNVAMLSQKAMSDMELSTVAYEAGRVPLPDMAVTLTHRFNRIISALVMASQITPQRHLEMAYANLGDSFGGSWRDKIEKGSQ